MTARVFIDGEAGTTGLRIRERLASRRDIELLSVDPARRKDPVARRDCLNAADAVILCLPDDAAREAVSLIDNEAVRVVDASTAHRTSPDWTYGFAELSSGQRQAIRSSKRVSNPGCYPTGFLALVRPLVEDGLLPADWPVTVNAVSGYSGGGRSMIAQFEDASDPAYTQTAYRPYAMTLNHKHVAEMQARSGLTHAPLFTPAVGRFLQGMIVEVPLQLWAIPGGPSLEDLRESLARAYVDQPFVEVASPDVASATSALDPEALNGTNRMRLYVFGSEAARQARLVAVLDNLGKGASGAAVQNLNLMLGLDETLGL
jgi:N-acetyl-gamma-glutamyl-phosphate reductase